MIFDMVWKSGIKCVFGAGLMLKMIGSLHTCLYHSKWHFILKALLIFVYINIPCHWYLTSFTNPISASFAATAHMQSNALWRKAISAVFHIRDSHDWLVTVIDRGKRENATPLIHKQSFLLVMNSWGIVRSPAHNLQTLGRKLYSYCSWKSCVVSRIFSKGYC